MFMCGLGEITWDGEGVVHSLPITDRRHGELGPQPGPQLLSGTRTQGVAAEQRQVPWARPAHLPGVRLRGSSPVVVAVSVHCPQTPPGQAAKGGRPSGWETPHSAPDPGQQCPRLLWSSGKSRTAPWERVWPSIGCPAFKAPMVQGPQSRGPPSSSPGRLDFLQTPASKLSILGARTWIPLHTGFCDFMTSGHVLPSTHFLPQSKENPRKFYQAGFARMGMKMAVGIRSS